MIDGADFRQSRSIESRARRLAEEIAGTVYVRLETGAGRALINYETVLADRSAKGE